MTSDIQSFNLLYLFIVTPVFLSAPAATMFRRQFGSHRNDRQQSEWVTRARTARTRRYAAPALVTLSTYIIGGERLKPRPHERDAAVEAERLVDNEKEKLEKLKRLAKEREGKPVCL